jgi:hypothetical protein
VANAARKLMVIASLMMEDKLEQLRILQQQLEDQTENPESQSELADPMSLRKELSKTEASSQKSAEVASTLISSIQTAPRTSWTSPK